MSDEPHNPPAADASSLEHIVDDLTSREQCADWVAQEVLAGRTAEAIAEDLVEEGWDAEQAAELVEYVRRATRTERGVVTREDVMRDADRRFRVAMTGWWWRAPLFPLLFVVSLIKLGNSVWALRQFKSVKNRKPKE